MNLYEIAILEREIEKRAAENDGEITEDDFKQLIEAQTTSIEKLENLCKYIRHLQLFQEQAKAEIARISELKKKAENRVNSIKKYILPYVKSKGKIDAGTFSLSTRKSSSVNLNDEFFRIYEQIESEYMKMKVDMIPDKKKIKEDLNNGNDIPGASIITKENVQIK